MSIFTDVKNSLTTRDAAIFYGIRINPHGFACCPFHSDKTPSCKIDKRFHCFGCGADGDVIDFTSRLFGIGNLDAARKLASDFKIPYEDSYLSGKGAEIKVSSVPKIKTFKDDVAYYLDLLSGEHCTWRTIVRRLEPDNPSDEWSDDFAYAVSVLETISNQIGILEYGTEEEQKELITILSRGENI